MDEKDCTKCDNCIRNYIEVDINQAQNYMPRRCLNRICRVSSSDTGMPPGLQFDPLCQTDKNSETSKSSISNFLDVNKSLSNLELTEFKTGEPKTRGKWLDDQTAGEKTDMDLAALDDSSDESDKANNNVEKCGDCSGCAAPDCGFCWPCIERDAQFLSKSSCTSKTCRRSQSKIKSADSIHEEKEIDVERQEAMKSRRYRMRCGTCPGCKTMQNCGVCTACIKKSKDKFFNGTCKVRKCHVLKSEKSQRCGQCESCQRLPCEDCGHCKAGKAHFCKAKMCKNPTWVKIEKKIPGRPKKKKSKSVEFIQDVSSENEMDSEEESFQDSQRKPLARKEGEQNGNKVSGDINAHKDKVRLRMRCGTCPGCKTLQNCGICNTCVKKKKNKLVTRVCNVRKCHVLKSEKSQRCGQCESCRRLPCEDCGHCKAGQANFCWAKRCKNPTWVKIKKRNPKNMKNKTKSVEFIQQVSSENEIDSEEESFGDSQARREGEQKRNKVSCDVKAHKDSKHIKRTKKCKKCDGCKAEDCRNCQSCKMNQQFGEKIVLGKLPCLTNFCKSPVELLFGKGKNKLLLLNEQDDAPEGATCPVKVIQGRLYDGRCYFCKKLPRSGKASKSELLRHYAVSHYSKQLKDEFAGVTFCRQCNLRNKEDATSYFAVYHYGQKHEEVVKYLPKEAAILLPEKKHQRSIVRRKVKRVVWPQIPEGFDSAAKTRDWKGDSNDDLNEEENVECETVDGWTIEHVIDEMDEPLASLDDPDFSGVGGICKVCQAEYAEVTAAAMHLHEDHHIQGGSSYIMRDCDKLIKSGFIKLVSQENRKGGDTVSEIQVKHIDKAESSEVCTSSRNSDEYLNFLKSKRSVARKSTSQKSRSSKTTIKEHISRCSSQNSSLDDEETSDHGDEIEIEREINLFKKEMELRAATTSDKDDENSMASHNEDGYLDVQVKRSVAWKSTSRKSYSSHRSSARMSSTSSFKLDSMRHSNSSKSVFEDEAQGQFGEGQFGDSDFCSSHAEYISPFWEAIGVQYQEGDE